MQVQSVLAVARDLERLLVLIHTINAEHGSDAFVFDALRANARAHFDPIASKGLRSELRIDRDIGCSYIDYIDERRRRLTVGSVSLRSGRAPDAQCGGA